MKQLFYLCCLTTYSVACFAPIYPITTEVMLSNSMKCTKEELMRFFPEQVVESILIKGNISKDKSVAIAKELADKDQELAKIVEEKTAKLDPNPYKNLNQREAAIKVYRETLYEVFSKVLKSHGVTNEDQILSILDELQEARSKLFIECIRKQPSLPYSDPSS